MSTLPFIVLRPDRICHVCRLGSRLDERVIGASVVYVGLEHDVDVHFDGGEHRRGRIVAIEPYRRHRVAGGRQYVCSILVEPESITDACLEDLVSGLNGASGDARALSRFLDCIRDLTDDPATLRSAFDRNGFDRTVFGRDLDGRAFDLRVERIIELFETDVSRPLDIESCARTISVTGSRFRRLFRESTGVQFRNYRMWKRVIACLQHIETPASLTQTALDLGYPDSTHFSHSIRQTYGLPPRDMKNYMRDSVFVIGKDIRKLQQLSF